MSSYAIVARQPGGVEVFEQKSFTPAAPGAGEILIRHTAIGLNFVDIYIRQGLYPWPQPRELILGSEAVGVIEALGPGVTQFQPGQRVAYTTPHGAYTTHRLIEAMHAVAVPDNIPDDVAAASLLKGLTVYYLLHSSFPVERGQDILFHAAAGGVGLLAGQWLAAKGVHAIGTAGGPEKCSLAARHGYDHVIDYRAEDFSQRVREIVGVGVDAVYDSVGQETYQGSLRCLKKFATLVCFGQSSGPALDFQIKDLAVGSFRLTRPTLYHYTTEEGWLARASAELFALIGAGTLRVHINQRFPLGEVAAAQQALEARQTTGCTILIP